MIQLELFPLDELASNTELSPRSPDQGPRTPTPSFNEPPSEENYSELREHLYSRIPSRPHLDDNYFTVPGIRT